MMADLSRFMIHAAGEKALLVWVSSHLKREGGGEEEGRVDNLICLNYRFCLELRVKAVSGRHVCANSPNPPPPRHHHHHPTTTV